MILPLIQVPKKKLFDMFYDIFSLYYTFNELIVSSVVKGLINMFYDNNECVIVAEEANMIIP